MFTEKVFFPTRSVYRDLGERGSTGGVGCEVFLHILCAQMYLGGQCQTLIGLSISTRPTRYPTFFFRLVKSEKKKLTALPLGDVHLENPHLPTTRTGHFRYLASTTRSPIMKTTWKDIPPVPTQQEFLDIALSRTQRKLPTQIRAGFKIGRIRGKKTLLLRSLAL